MTYFKNLVTNNFEYRPLSELSLIKKGTTIDNCQFIITEEQAICEHCGEIINLNDDDDTYEYDSNNGKYYCIPCYEENYIRCDYCGEIIHIDNSIWIKDQELSVCEYCANHHYNRCVECGEYFENTYTTINGDEVCEHCRNNNYVTCECCGELVHEDYILWSEGDDCYYCQNCYEENVNNYIHEYGWEPNDWIQHSTINEHITDTTRFYGFELEVEGDEDYAEPFMIDYDEQSDIFLTHDGSLDRGFEITSHPLTYEFLFNSPFTNTFKKSLKKLQDWHFIGHNAGGLHIHVNRTAIKSHLQRVLLYSILYNPIKSRQYNIILQITQRQQEKLERWSSLDSNELYGINKKEQFLNLFLKHSFPSDKYQGINSKHCHTYEFRIFNSNLRLERLEKNYQFIELLLDYTEYLAATYNSVSIYKHINKLANIYEVFRFMMQNRFKYDELVNFLNEKHIFVTETPSKVLQAA